MFLERLFDVVTLGLTYYIRKEIDKKSNQHLVNQSRALTAHVDTKVKQETQRAMADAIKQNNTREVKPNEKS